MGAPKLQVSCRGLPRPDFLLPAPCITCWTCVKDPTIAVKASDETDQQDMQEEAQGLTTIINAREEYQQKVKNLIALKTREQEGDAKGLEVDSRAKSMTTTINAIKEKATEPEKTYRSGNTQGGDEAREPAAVDRRAGKTITAKTREDQKPRRPQEPLKSPPPIDPAI